MIKLMQWGFYALTVLIVMFALWLWWFADCSVIQAVNSSVPGRCLE